MGSSFGTKKKNVKRNKPAIRPTRTPLRTRNPNKARGGSSPSLSVGSPAFTKTTASPGYDNPISSYDAPIINDKSYTAPVRI